MKQKETMEPMADLLWLWKNQPPVTRWWFTLSGISILAVYFVLITCL